MERERETFPTISAGFQQSWMWLRKDQGDHQGLKGNVLTVPPHCRLDSPGGQHSWGNTPQVIGDSILQGVLLLHHKDGEALHPHQDALLVIHFEEENLDLETEERNDLSVWDS